MAIVPAMVCRAASGGERNGDIRIEGGRGGWQLFGSAVCVSVCSAFVYNFDRPIVGST